MSDAEPTLRDVLTAVKDVRLKLDAYDEHFDRIELRFDEHGRRLNALETPRPTEP